MLLMMCERYRSLSPSRFDDGFHNAEAERREGNEEWTKVDFVVAKGDADGWNAMKMKMNYEERE
jgi:hypothetical protein